MPRNNSYARRAQRKQNLELRTVELNKSDMSVAQREASRGHDQRLIKELQEEGSMSE